MKFSYQYRAGSVLLTALWLSGCGSDPGFNETTDFVRTEGSAQFINMMADSPELTVIHGLNNTTVAYPFTSGIEVRVSDNYDWRVAYLDSATEEVTVAEEDDQQIAENVLSTFLLMGDLVQPDIQIVDIALTPLEDRPEDKMELWFASNSSQYAMVDIYLTGFGADLAASAPLTALNSGTYSQVFDVAAGDSQQLRITNAGTSDLIFDSGEIIMPPQSLELMALVDDFGPESSGHVDVIRTLSANRSLMDDDSQPSKARVANLSAIEPLEVVAAGTTFSALNSGDRTAYTSVATGSQTITATGPTGTTGEDPVFFTNGEFLSVLIVDDTAADNQPASNAAVLEDSKRTITDRALFQFVNGSAGIVDLFALRGDETTDGIAPTFNDSPRGVSGTVEVLTGAARFVVMNSDNSTTYDSAELTLVEGKSYTLVFDGQEKLRLLED